MNVNIPENDKLTILGVSVKFQCKKCGSSWGIYLNTVTNVPPEGWDTCRTCNKNLNHGESKYGIQEIPRQGFNG